VFVRISLPGDFSLGFTITITPFAGIAFGTLAKGFEYKKDGCYKN
jgi:hypothetical protein